jgi:hypothetical protein
MLINLQLSILFHRHSAINGTDEEEIMNCLKYTSCIVGIRGFYGEATKVMFVL